MWTGRQHRPPEADGGARPGARETQTRSVEPTAPCALRDFGQIPPFLPLVVMCVKHPPWELDSFVSSPGPQRPFVKQKLVTEAWHREQACPGSRRSGVRASVLPGPVGAEREEALSPMKRRKSPE